MSPERANKQPRLFFIVLLMILSHHRQLKSAVDAEDIWEEKRGGRYSLSQSKSNASGDGLVSFLRTILTEELSECSLGVIWSEEEEGKEKDGLEKKKKDRMGTEEKWEMREEEDQQENNRNEKTVEEMKVEKSEKNELSEREKTEEDAEQGKKELKERELREQKENEAKDGYVLAALDVIFASPRPHQVS